MNKIYLAHIVELIRFYYLSKELDIKNSSFLPVAGLAEYHRERVSAPI